MRSQDSRCMLVAGCTLLLLLIVAETICAGEITIASWAAGIQPNAENNIIVEEFNKDYPDIKIKLFYAASAEFNTKITLMLATGDAPDVMWINQSRHVRFQDQLTDLTPYIQRSNVNLSELALGGRVVPQSGPMYAIGGQTMLNAIHYDKLRFANAGIAEPRRGWTWDDFRTIAKKLTEPEKGLYGFEWAYSETKFFPFVWQAGGAPYDPTGKVPTFFEKPALEAMQFWQDLLVKDKIAQSGATLSARQAAMRYDWTNAMTSRIPQDELGLAVPPRGPVAEATSALLEGWAIPAGAKNKDDAWTFIRWYISPKGAAAMARALRTALPSYLPTIAQVTLPSYDESLRRTLHGMLADGLSMGRCWHPGTLEAERTIEIFRRATGRVWSGEISPSMAADAAKPQIEAVLAELAARAQ